MIERAVRAERFHEAGDRARLLPDRDIDADDVLIFWFKMASRAMAVLPVPLSPMMSSRCPLPMGNMLSMARMPVSKGLLTG